jgi:hypothetical protein
VSDDPPPGGSDDPDEPPAEPSTSGRADRLDPDLAVAAAGGVPKFIEPVIDTRRYQWAIGLFGLVLVLAFSVYLFAHNGVRTPGVAGGKQLHRFVAPLATSGLNGDANTKPRCDPRAPNPRALNVCGRTALVLDFFVTGSGACKKQVDTLQRIAPSFPGIQFAAVAVKANRSDTVKLIHSHHWTIPVAYDRDGAVGELYGIDICPLLELVRPGGSVAARLIGEKWLHPDDLRAQVRRWLG